MHYPAQLVLASPLFCKILQGSESTLGTRGRGGGAKTATHSICFPNCISHSVDLGDLLPGAEPTRPPCLRQTWLCIVSCHHWTSPQSTRTSPAAGWLWTHSCHCTASPGCKTPRTTGRCFVRHDAPSSSRALISLVASLPPPHTDAHQGTRQPPRPTTSAGRPRVGSSKANTHPCKPQHPFPCTSPAIQRRWRWRALLLNPCC